MKIDNHISYRGTKGNEKVKTTLKTYGKKINRSLNFIVEQALLQYIKKNNLK